MNSYFKNNKNNKFNNKSSNKLFMYVLLIFFITLITLSSFLIFFKFIFLPKEISILVGNEYKIDFNIPAVTTITCDDPKVNINNNSSMSVDSVDSVNSINSVDSINNNINNSIISNNLNFNNNSLYISATEEGSHNLTVSMLGIPISNIPVSVLPDVELIPSGKSIGVRINTNGIMVLGFGEVIDELGEKHEPAKNVLKSGDMILKINNTIDNTSTLIDSKETLAECIKEAPPNTPITFEINRKDEIIIVEILPVCDETGENKIGIWVRDSTQGVGTLTYINPMTLEFGSLGHGIVDVDTQEIMQVRDGKIMETQILDIKKGEKGSPGELIGDIKNTSSLGEITLNSELGIYGTVYDDSLISTQDSYPAYPVGLKNTIEEGEASILCTLQDNTVKEYSIQIQGINKYSLDNSKSMIIQITDPELINATSGIIQGMSGSPILQNNKIIGAVTHVFVNDPTKGYGIFIENMLNATK